MSERSGDSAGLTRRSLLAAGATALGASAGCVARVRNVFARDPASQISLRILAVPADSNPVPIGIARRIADNLRACGIEADVVPMSPEALYRDVLLNHEFDLYVGQFHRPEWLDPDGLYGLLHSAYASEPGWQNPFGYTNVDLDAELERQRTQTGGERRRAVDAVQRSLVETQPFTTVAFPDALGAVRTDRFRHWRGRADDPLTLLGVDSAPDASADALRLGTTDSRITKNRNPIAAEFRHRGTFVDLLYDPLARRIDGVFEPWLAENWQFSREGDRLTATVRLRDEAAWHDGESLTADDVAFTYRFLADTTLGNAESPIPASRFRGRVSLVEDATAVDDRTVEFAFADASSVVAKRAFSVPVLPEHVWQGLTGFAEVAGMGGDRQMTEALAWNNPDAVGSGPFRFERAVPADSLRLSRFDDHFLTGDGVDALPEWLSGGLPYDEVEVTVAGTDDSAVELVATGDADATVAPLHPSVAPRIGRESALDLISVPSRAFYHIGYNTREAPLSNVRFRQVVARLVDEAGVVESVFDGYATPAASPLDGTGWVPDDLTWNDTDPGQQFFGADGDLDAAAAREAFEEVGYRYDDGELLAE